MGNAIPTMDELSMMIVEVEAVLNSRPLTYIVAKEIEDPLTPVGRRLIGTTRCRDYTGDEYFLVPCDCTSITARMEHIQWREMNTLLG